MPMPRFYKTESVTEMGGFMLVKAMKIQNHLIRNKKKEVVPKNCSLKWVMELRPQPKKVRRLNSIVSSHNFSEMPTFYRF